MSRARFDVAGALDQGAGFHRGTVTIDRGTGLFEVRPLRRRRVYVLPLATVATIVVQKILRQEAAERLRERRKKGGRRRGR